MTKSVGVHEAKTHLSRLLDEVERGERIVVTRRGREVAHLVPPPPAARRVFGKDAGVFTVPDDFDEPLPEEILREFEG